MEVVAQASPLPNIVSGTNPTTFLPAANGITAGPQPVKLFTPTLNVPGSLRLDGQQVIVRAAGNLTAGISSNTQLSLYVNYPTLTSGTLQYPNANITAANTINLAGTGFALFNANNNFVVGQYVSVAAVNAQYNAIIGPLSIANSTAFGGFINGAAAVNASGGATVNTSAVGYAVMLPQPLYCGQNVATVANVGQILPFSAEIRLIGEQGANVVYAFGNDGIANYNAASSVLSGFQPSQNTGNVFAVPGINFKNEPPFSLSVGETFGVSNASHTATLKMFRIET